MDTTRGWEPRKDANHGRVGTMAECKPQKWKPWNGHHRVTMGVWEPREDANHGGWEPRQSVNHKSANHGRVGTMQRCKPRSNHTGWKPQKGGNHREVETIGGWKPQKGGNLANIKQYLQK